MSRRLDPDEIDTQLTTLPDWQHSGSALLRDLEAPNFPAAIAIVSDVAEVAEQMDHHPDIDIRWRRLHLSLSTHSAGGVTQLDIELVHRIDGIAAEHQAH